MSDSIESDEVVELELRREPGEEERRVTLWYRLPEQMNEWAQHPYLELMLELEDLTRIAEAWSARLFPGRRVVWKSSL
jgi:hypothetical protein